MGIIPGWERKETRRQEAGYPSLTSCCRVIKANHRLGVWREDFANHMCRKRYVGEGKPLEHIFCLLCRLMGKLCNKERHCANEVKCQPLDQAPPSRTPGKALRFPSPARGAAPLPAVSGPVSLHLAAPGFMLALFGNHLGLLLTFHSAEVYSEAFSWTLISLSSQRPFLWSKGHVPLWESNRECACLYQLPGKLATPDSLGRTHRGGWQILGSPFSQCPVHSRGPPLPHWHRPSRCQPCLITAWVQQRSLQKDFSLLSSLFLFFVCLFC